MQWFFLFVVFATALFADPLEIMTENLPPFNYEENGQIKGISVEIVREILQEVGHPDHIEVLPWARAYRIINHKDNCVLFSMSRRPEREKKFKWVGPLVEQNYYFYKRQGSPITIDTLDQARNLKSIGVPRDFMVHILLETKNFKNLDVSNHPVQDLKKLMLNRVDVVPMGELNLIPTLKEAGISPDQVERTGHIIYHSVLYIAFSPNIDDQIIQTWQEALDKLKANGTYQKIRDKYLQ